jgi:hypothetical protein
MDCYCPYLEVWFCFLLKCINNLWHLFMIDIQFIQYEIPYSFHNIYYIILFYISDLLKSQSHVQVCDNCPLLLSFEPRSIDHRWHEKLVRL